jgi:hypothetical protein
LEAVQWPFVLQNADAVTVEDSVSLTNLQCYKPNHRTYSLRPATTVILATEVRPQISLLLGGLAVLHGLASCRPPHTESNPILFYCLKKISKTLCYLFIGLFVWLVADDWCWFVLREKYCWLVVGG